jgi:hypothetical protein
MPVIEGTIGPIVWNATATGAPSTGNDGVLILAIAGTASSGTFKLKYEGFVTGTIANNASAANVATALNALPSIGASGVACSGGALGTAVVITFNGANHAKKTVSALTVAENSLVGGGAPTITTSTTAVTALFRGIGYGGLVINTFEGKMYQNTTAVGQVASWTIIGSVA